MLQGCPVPCAHIKSVKFKLKSHDKKERYLQIFIRLSWFSRIPNTSFFAHRHDWSGQWKGSISSHKGLKSERKCNLESYTVCIKGKNQCFMNLFPTDCWSQKRLWSEENFFKNFTLWGSHVQTLFSISAHWQFINAFNLSST